MSALPGRDLTACGPTKPLFLVNKAWTDRYFSSEPKRMIANAPLVDLSKGCHSCRQVVLRQGLEEDKDFKVVDADRWTNLCDSYGTDYEICRFRAVPKPLAMKGECVKADGKKKLSKKAPSTHAVAVEPGRGELSLVLFPDCASLLYRDPVDADTDFGGKIVECYHSECKHPIRIPLGLSPSAEGLGRLARQEITRCMELDVATYEWLQLDSRRGCRFDYMYYDLKLEMWKLWRSTHPLPADRTRVVSPETATMMLCVRKRLTHSQFAELVAVTEKAEDKLRKKESRRKRKESDATDSDASDSSEDQRGKRVAKRSKRTAAQRERTRDEETESDVEIEVAETQRKKKPSGSGTRGSAGNGAGASNDSQKTPPTQPEAASEVTRQHEEDPALQEIRRGMEMLNKMFEAYAKKRSVV